MVWQFVVGLWTHVALRADVYASSSLVGGLGVWKNARLPQWVCVCVSARREWSVMIVGWLVVVSVESLGRLLTTRYYIDRWCKSGQVRSRSGQ